MSFTGNTFSKFVLLAGLILGGMILWSIISLIGGLVMGVDNLSHLDLSNNIGVIRFTQIMSSICIFILPAMGFARVVNKGAGCYLKIDEMPMGGLLIIVFAVMLLFLPGINLSGVLNSKMVFPEFLSGLETMFREMEERAMKLTYTFLKMDNSGDFVFNIFMIAVLPAVGEELLFRGVLQRLFNNATKNIHISIFITSVLFSALHGQFFGFLPRFLLGTLFGYIFYWSGNMWYAVLAHFVNNAAAVASYYFYGTEYVEENIDNYGTELSNILIVLVVSTLAFSLLMNFRKRTTGRMLFNNDKTIEQ